MSYKASKIVQQAEITIIWETYGNGKFGDSEDADKQERFIMRRWFRDDDIHQSFIVNIMKPKLYGAYEFWEEPDKWWLGLSPNMINWAVELAYLTFEGGDEDLAETFTAKDDLVIKRFCFSFPNSMRLLTMDIVIRITYPEADSEFISHEMGNGFIQSLSQLPMWD